MRYVLNPIFAFIISFFSGFFRMLGARACRFHPSCSVYCREVLEKQGLLRALGLCASRLLRCQPFSQGGFDPVP